MPAAEANDTQHITTVNLVVSRKSGWQAALAEAALCMQAERDRNSSIVAALEEERAAAMAAAQRQV